MEITGKSGNAGNLVLPDYPVYPGLSGKTRQSGLTGLPRETGSYFSRMKIYPLFFVMIEFTIYLLVTYRATFRYLHRL